MEKLIVNNNVYLCELNNTNEYETIIVTIVVVVPLGNGN